jgi:prevent-host-death family protein
MPRIRPISALRNTNELSDFCHASDEPVYITKNGYDDLVIMSIESFERQQTMIEIYKKLGEAEDSIIVGAELMDDEDVFGSLRKHYANK